MSILSSIVHKIFYRTAEKNAEWYRKNTDIKMGENVRIFPGVCIGSEPYLIEIGDNVEITDGVRFLTHDGGVKVPMNMGICKNADLFGRIKVGNNVFIGVNSIILPGSVIPDNVIIGAGSIVTRKTAIPKGSVMCGAPARYLCTIEEYYQRNIEFIFETDCMDYKEKMNFVKTHIQ